MSITAPPRCVGPFSIAEIAPLAGSSERLLGLLHMTRSEFRFATAAILDAQQSEVRVRATNVGRSDAVDVRFGAPIGYRQTAGPRSAFDLPPGAAQVATFEATPNAPDFRADDFDPLWSATRAVDVWGLILKAAGGRRQADDLGNSNECHPIPSVASSSQ